MAEIFQFIEEGGEINRNTETDFEDISRRIVLFESTVINY
jgi:hypothetical protein